MAVCLHHTIYGPIWFYPPKKGGRLIPCYEDIHTRDVLIGGKNSGALYDLLRSLNPNSTKLYLPGYDGKLHHVALYVDSSGRTCINTFNQPELPCFVGSNQDYSPDIIGVSMYLKGLPQTTENVLSELGYPDGNWFTKWYQDPFYGAGRQMDALVKGGVKVQEKTEVPENRRSANAEEVEARKSLSASMNEEVIKKSLENGKIQMSYEKDGLIYVPDNVIKCLKERGIDSRKLSIGALRNIGYCTGMKPYNSEGKSFKTMIQGFMIRLGGKKGTSWQVRVCNRKPDGSITFRTKKQGNRFVTMGPAYPFLLEEAIAARSADRRPIVLSEGMFDTLSMDAASNGRISAASIQGCQNQSYITQAAERIAKAGIPVIVAFDPDRSGQTNSEDLIRQLKSAGVHVYTWPGALIPGGDMNDLLKTEPQAAEALVKFMSDMVMLNETGKMTPAMANSITGRNAAFTGMTGHEAVEATFEMIRETCGTKDIPNMSDRAEKITRAPSASEVQKTGHNQER